jgi:hypothetical protein
MVGEHEKQGNGNGDGDGGGFGKGMGAEGRGGRSVVWMPEGLGGECGGNGGWVAGVAEVLGTWKCCGGCSGRYVDLCRGG